MDNYPIYAKLSKINDDFKTETLEEHTKNLLKNLQKLKIKYPEIQNIYSEKFDNNNYKTIWDLLELACLFHDLGKISYHFQNKLRKIFSPNNLLKIPNEITQEIPHNFLSPAFMIFIKNIDKKMEFPILFYSILYHHDKKLDFDEHYLKKVIEKDLKTKIDKLDWLKEFGFEINNNLFDRYHSYIDYNSNKYNQIIKEYKKQYILLKGLLHRIDHSASGHLEIEEERINNPYDKLIIYLNNKGIKSLRDFQKNISNYRNKSILQIASTGIGKTEFAINWIGDSKAFYVLPLKVSVNAMYERFCQIFNDNKIGLLHGDNFIYELQKNNMNFSNNSEDNLSIEESLQRINISKQFSMPLTITTADQLFSSVFKYKGYEKVYATLIYSKIVLDEPQAYTPEILGMIVQMLKEISELGGKFCLMSATINPILKKELKNYCEILDPVYNTEKKHILSISKSDIDELIPKIIEKYNENKKILVIVNTVKKSQDLFEKIKEKGAHVKLINSYFIKKDRLEKENEIKFDFLNDKPVIWISTQIVEASLDIDYDILFSEMATIDALVQRMGRIYRHRKYVLDEPNIYISTENPSDKGYIYDKGIVKNTKEFLYNYDQKILYDQEKQKLMEDIYDEKNEESKKFNKEFKKVLTILEAGFQADKKSEAQKLFRKIENINIIPFDIYEENKEEIKEYIKKIKLPNKKEKYESIYNLNNFSVNVPIFREKNLVEKLKKDLFVLSCNYSKEKGIIFDRYEEEDSIFI